MMKQILFAIPALLLSLTASADVVVENDSYQVVKVSNPDHGEGEADGLVVGGDRGNSYTWRMAMRGDEIYVATARNIGSALVNMYASAFTGDKMTLDQFWTLIDAVDGGDIPRADENDTGANIIAYNRTTGEFRVVYTADKNIFFRSSVTFGDNVYFGSYSADPSVEHFILKLDTEGNFTKVYRTMGAVSMRANCVYDGHLYFGGVDEREEVSLADFLVDFRIPTKMAVLRKSNDDDSVWERVADYRDFGETAYDDIMSSWAGAPIWELASHGGYIYATAPSTAGFVIYKGHPAAEGEQPNAYGWHWQEVAGPNNGVNNPGLSFFPWGEPGTMRSLIGSVYEFNGQLYAFNFDHAFGGVATAFGGFMQQMAGQKTKPSDYLSYMYNSLQNPQKVWRLNDETGVFEELTAFTALMQGTTNEYVWRMGEYDGQLYIATMDAATFYRYFTQFTNGSFFQMSKAELIAKLADIAEAVGIIIMLKGNEIAAELETQLQALQLLVQIYTHYEDQDGEMVPVVDYEGLTDAIKLIIQTTIDSLPGETLTQKAILYVLEKAKTALQDIVDNIDLKGIEMYLSINRAVMNDEAGFDLFRTADGEHFEAVTRNGFGDRFNYGCSSFLATDEGLYIGTCNPFYGGQLYLLTNTRDETTTATEETTTHIMPLEGTGHSQPFFTLSGQAVSGTPTQPGIYIKDGRKIIIK